MTTKHIIIATIALSLGIGFGWWLSAWNSEEVVREEVRYIERPSTHIDLYMPQPIKVGRIDLPKLQYHDTITITEHIPADTAGIIADYLKKREYELDFSTDSIGVYKVQAVVYCNRLASASATIVPLQREVETTIVNVRNFRPYIGGGVGVGSTISASCEIGALLKEHHLPRVGYQRVGNGNFITINYGYLF